MLAPAEVTHEDIINIKARPSELHIRDMDLELLADQDHQTETTGRTLYSGLHNNSGATISIF